MLDTLFQRSTVVRDSRGGMEQSDLTMYGLKILLDFSKDEFGITVENLIRLRLCWVDSAWNPYGAFDRDSGIRLLLTAFGRSFVAACKGPSGANPSTAKIS